MDISAFIQALSESIFLSFGQVLFIWIGVKALFSTFNNLSPNLKYKVLYSSLGLAFALFVYSLLSLYLNKLSIERTRAELIMPTDMFHEESRSWIRQLLVFGNSYAGLVTCFYFLGLAYQLTVFVMAYVETKALRRKGTLLNNPLWISRFEVLSRKTDVLKEVSVYISSKISIPFTTGFVKPLILLPLGMFNNLSVEQVEAILLHELAHIKRNDYLLNIFQRVMEVVLFFNPVVWLLSRAIRNEREYCCDEMVVKETSDTVTYAKALLLLEEQRHEYKLALAANGNKKYSLLTRIKRITVMETFNASPKHQLIALAAVVSIGLSLAWAVPSDAKKAIAVKKAPLFANRNIVNNDIAPQYPARQDTVPAETKAGKVLVAKRDSAGFEDADIADSAFAYFKSSEWKHIQKNIQKEAEEINKFYSTAEWKKQEEEIRKNAEQIKKHFDSPEWKKQEDEIKKQAEEVSKHFNSAKWKKQEEDIRKNTKAIAKKLDTPEWRKQQEEIAKKGAELAKKFDSPEWKQKQEALIKQGEELRKKFDSPEWKKKQDEIQKNAEELRKKFESFEWKEKMKKVEQYYNSPEWKAKEAELEKDMEQEQQKTN